MATNIVQDDQEVETNVDLGKFVNGIMQEDPALKAEQEESDDKEGVPDKFKGKSLDEVIASYKNLESEYGRMAQEIGHQRQLLDQAILNKREKDLSDNDPNHEPEFDVQDFLDNPKKVLEQYMGSKLSKLQESYNDRINDLETRLAQETFTARHSDVNEIAQSQEWQSWLQSSPIRMRAAAQAKEGDYTVAAELLDEFKAQREAQSHSNKAKNDPMADARAASLEGGSTNDSEGGVMQGKIISRQALQKLRATDPDAYNDPAFQQKVVEAYQQGRVR